MRRPDGEVFEYIFDELPAENRLVAHYFVSEAPGEADAENVWEADGGRGQSPEWYRRIWS